MHVTFDPYNFEEAAWMQANSYKVELAMSWLATKQSWVVLWKMYIP